MAKAALPSHPHCGFPFCREWTGQKRGWKSPERRLGSLCKSPAALANSFGVGLLGRRMGLRRAAWSPAEALAKSQCLGSGPCLDCHSIPECAELDLLRASQVHMGTAFPWALPPRQHVWPELTVPAD